MGPNVFGVNGVVVESQTVAGPVSDDGAECVMVDGIFFVFAPKCAVAVEFLSETSSRAPPAKDGVPASEADSRGHVFHDVFKVIDASSGVDPRPTQKVPFGQMLSDPFLHVESGKLS